MRPMICQLLFALPGRVVDNALGCYARSHGIRSGFFVRPNMVEQHPQELFLRHGNAQHVGRVQRVTCA